MVFNENLYMIGSTLFVLGYTCATVRGSDSFTYESNSKKTSEPACYGSTYTSFVSLSCPQSEVVYPLEVYVGAKPNSTGCLDFENDYTEHDKDLKEKCCRNINETTDCTGEYNGPNRTLIIETCMGLSLCKNIHVVWESTSNMSCSAEHHYKSTTNYAYLDYFCIKKATIGTPVRNHRYQSRNSGMFYLTANDINSYKSGMLDRNVTCSIRASTNLSTIEVWIMDLRFRRESLQKVIIYDGSTGKQLGGSNHTRPFLQPISSSSSINITFETVRSSDEFLWLGFAANDAYIVIACDVSDGTQITGDVEPLSQEKKQNGYMVAGIAGGIGFLAVCVIIGFMVYRRIKANKTNRKVEDDRRNLPKNEDTPGMNNVSNNVKELQ